MKSLFRLLLFASLVFLAGCTITKRRYTGGYSVNWHNSKPSDIRAISHQALTKYDGSNKIIHRILSPSIAKNAINTQKALAPEKEEIIYKNKAVSKITPILKLIPPSFSYTAPPDGIPGHNVPKKNTSKKNLTLCEIFCLLEFISILAIILIGSIIINIPIYVTILPLLSFILSLVFGILARKDGYKMGLHIVLISNIVFLVIIIIAGIVNLNENGI